MTSAINELHGAGELDVLDVQFARAMGRLAGDMRPDVLLAAALVSNHVSKGDVCLELGTLHERSVGKLPALSDWLDQLRASAMVSDGSSRRPLVLDGNGRLYLRRYWEHEQRLVHAIGIRAQQIDASVDEATLEAGLTRLFGPMPRPSRRGKRAKPTTQLSLFAAPSRVEPDLQRAAAKMAVQRRFSVVSGGPGTGKTFTVVKILALLVEQSLHAGEPPPIMTIVAPTGKAAARLSESIKQAKDNLACLEQVKVAIAEDATTIHRALGSIHGTSTRFHHNEKTPLVTDLVLVDEASMVNLALMARLVAAVPKRARLILLGDKDQLASVEAGAVLGDICNTSGGGQRPAAARSSKTGIWDCVTHLTRSYRYKPGSGIEALAKAINDGDSAAALAVLTSDAPDVSLEAPAATGQLGDALATAALDGYSGYLTDARAFERVAAFDNFRVLCGHRVGSRGVDTINQQIRDLLRSRGKLHGRSDFYVGRPVMVTANNYELRLFNGDIGLVLPNPNGGGLRASFGKTEEDLRLFAPSRLPAHETVFAMSVHKSQGSEFDTVAVVLPDQASRVVTRELLYTAVTRAKRRVVIHATPAVVRHTIERRIVRASGLRHALWG